MAGKSKARKATAKPLKMNREARRRRTLNILFLVFSGILILSMILSQMIR